MTTQEPFAYVAPELVATLEELSKREPIFHTPEFGRSRAELERSTAPDYWEVGASGRRYSRDFIINSLAQKSPVNAAEAGWVIDGFGLRRLGEDTYLLTYALRQDTRVTRRMTIWQSHSEGWRVLYHQGTVVTAEESDTVRSQCE